MVSKKVYKAIEEAYIDLRERISEVGRQIPDIEQAKRILKEAEEKEARYIAIENKYRDMCSAWERTEHELNDALEKNDSLEKDLFYARQASEHYLVGITELTEKLAEAGKIKKELEEKNAELTERIGALKELIARVSGGINE